MSTPKRVTTLKAVSAISAATMSFTGLVAMASTATAAPMVSASIQAEEHIAEITTSAEAEKWWNKAKTHPVLFLVTAPGWCGPCRQLDPKLRSAAKRDGGKWTLVSIDVTDSKTAAFRYIEGKIGRVEGYPTTAYVGGGKVVAKNHGGSYEADIKKMIAASPSNPVDPQPTPTAEPTATPTVKPTETPVKPTPTMTPTSTPTSTPTVKPTETPVKPDPTMTPTATPTATPTPDPDKPGDEKPSKHIITVTPENYDAVMEMSKKTPVILDFGKEMCGPCDALLPVLKEKVEADGGKWILAKVDGWTYKDIWAKYNNPWFPTLIYISGGEEKARRTGYEGEKAAVHKWIDDCLAGNFPVTDPAMIDVVERKDWEKMNEISYRHPVAARLNFDKFFRGQDTGNREILKKMAEGDGGKWTLANIDVTSPGGMWFALRNKQWRWPSLSVYYQARVQANKPFVGKGTEEQLREWVNTMLSTKYPHNPKPGTGKPKPTPTDKPTATPTETPTATPTTTPTDKPTATPTDTGKPKPTGTPTEIPQPTVTENPTATPTVTLENNNK